MTRLRQSIGQFGGKAAARRAIAFAAIFAAGLLAYFLTSTSIQFRSPDEAKNRPIAAAIVASGQVVQKCFIQPYQRSIAASAGYVLRFCGCELAVSGREIRQLDGSFTVSISNGCDCIELTILFCSAVLAFPGSLPRKLAGLVLGTVAIAVLNFVRILTLWGIGSSGTAYFDFAHFTAWPFVLFCATLGLFTLWVRFATKTPLEKAATLAVP